MKGTPLAEERLLPGYWQSHTPCGEMVEFAHKALMGYAFAFAARARTARIAKMVVFIDGLHCED
jgi:hypothetical protein